MYNTHIPCGVWSYILEPSLTTDSNLSRFLETWWQKSRYLYIKTITRLIRDCTWAIFNVFSNCRPLKKRQGLLVSGLSIERILQQNMMYSGLGILVTRFHPEILHLDPKQPIWLIASDSQAFRFCWFLSVLPLICSKWWQVTFKVSKKEGYRCLLRFLKSLLHVRDLFWSKWLFEGIHGHAGKCYTNSPRGNDLMICALASNLKTCCFS